MATTQSDGLRNRLATMHGGGQHLNDDSKDSEGVLRAALENAVIPYAKHRASLNGWTIEYVTKIDLYDMQCMLEKMTGGDCPKPDPANKRVCMKPDGGILSVKIDENNVIPILISEDKKQGTNDCRLAEGKKKQATGNALERGIKNIRAAEMMFQGGTVFPYVLFGSGCDLHPTETIAKRLEVGNYGHPNHNIVLTPTKTHEEIQSEVNTLVQNLNITKRYGGKCIATMCIKSHKWDEMAHNSSAWSEREIADICCQIVTLAFDDLEKRYKK